MLELGLCFQVLRLARVKTQVTVTRRRRWRAGKRRSCCFQGEHMLLLRRRDGYTTVLRASGLF